jgi:hypothetical protein
MLIPQSLPGTWHLRWQVAEINITAEVRMRVRRLCLLSILLAILTACVPAAQTATPPAETATPAPIALINVLQDYLDNMDPVGAMLDAEFKIVDVAYAQDAEGKKRILIIHINCDDKGTTCGPERSFSVVVQALRAKKKKLPDVLPQTLVELQVYTYDHLSGTGIAKTSWQDVQDYYNDVINGAQLARRVVITR